MQTWAFRASAKVWATVWSIEAFYALFLFAATLKKQPLFSSIPIDLTVVAAGVLLGTFAFRLVVGRVTISHVGLEALGLSALQVAYLLLSFVWAPLPNGTKAVGALLVWGAFVIGILLFSTDDTSFRRFSNVLLMFGLYGVFVVWKGASLGASYALREAYLQQAGSYLTLGSILAIAALVSAHRFFRGERLIGLPSFAYLLPLGATLAALALNNSRQSLLGCLLGMMILGFVHRPRLRSGRLVLTHAWVQVAIAAIVVAPLVVHRMDSMDFRAVERLQNLFSRKEGRANVSANERLRHWGQVGRNWDRHPIRGHGIGAYGAQLNLTGETNDHPHNIWMELLYEGGLIAVALAATILILLLRGLNFAAFLGRDAAIVAAVVVSFAVAGSVSGSYGDTRGNMMAVSLLTLPMVARKAPRPASQEPVPVGA